MKRCLADYLSKELIGQKLVAWNEYHFDLIWWCITHSPEIDIVSKTLIFFVAPDGWRS